jgi:redox-sensitive bicupin YhaK (pirin superfamily)
MNPSASEPVHFLQIWIRPSAEGILPSYEQRHFSPEEKRGVLRLVASPDGTQGSVRINQDVRIYAGLFDGSERAELAIAAPRRAYVHLARGHLKLNGVELAAGDGVQVSDVSSLAFSEGRAAEVLVFDLPS